MQAIGLKGKIKKWFVEAVKLNPEVSGELQRKLTREYPPDPHVEKFLDNLAEQFIKADQLLQKQGLFVKEKTMQDTVYDMTKVFITAIELEAKRMYESDLEKAARRAKEDEIKAMDDFLAGGTDNEYAEELGLINEEVKVKDAGPKH